MSTRKNKKVKKYKKGKNSRRVRNRRSSKRTSSKRRLYIVTGSGIRLPESETPQVKISTEIQEMHRQQEERRIREEQAERRRREQEAERRRREQARIAQDLNNIGAIRYTIRNNQPNIAPEDDIDDILEGFARR